MHQNRNCAPGNHREHYSRLPTKEPAAPLSQGTNRFTPRAVEGDYSSSTRSSSSSRELTPILR